MLVKAVLDEAKRVFKKVSDKRGITYGVAHAKRTNTARKYVPNKIPAIYQANLADYNKSIDEVSASFRPTQRHKRPK